MGSANNQRLNDLNAILGDLQSKANAQHQSLIVSIDLGTTYSGYVHYSS
jgi:hypothetical protein